MDKKITIVIGILVLLLTFGAISVAMAQNTGDERTKGSENHECTPEMMENMPDNCPEQMMQSGACEEMMNGTNGCDKMMDDSKPAEDTETKEYDHCANMGSGIGSMMDSGATGF